MFESQGRKSTLQSQENTNVAKVVDKALNTAEYLLTISTFCFVLFTRQKRLIDTL